MYRLITAIFILTNCSLISQIDTSLSLTFDFNENLIKEVNNKVDLKSGGVTLTNDRFGNEKSAVFIHGNISSYLNLSTSPLVKPINGSISIWVNLDRKIYAGKGYESNPIILTKNAKGDDFIIAYSILFDCYSNKLLSCLSKDSLNESIIVAEEKFNFNKWYHLAITFDDKFLSFYVNGALQQRQKKNFKTKYLETDSVIIGHSASKKNERYSLGTFDDIKIFHRVLSEEEIQDLYNAPNPNRLKNIFTEVGKYIVIIIIFLVILFIIVILNKRKLKRQKEYFELQNKINELEIKVIKGQINPHFISNCLAAIQNLVLQNQPDIAGQYIAKFNHLMRKVLSVSDKTFIYLSEEIEIIRLNIELEQLRFKHEFNFQFSIRENIDTEELLVPSLITQPIIENAIWHGLLPLKGKRGAWLNIHVFFENNFLMIEIIDNGVGRGVYKVNNQSKGTKLVYDKLQSVNKLSNFEENKLSIIDLFDINGNAMGTQVRIQLEYKIE